MKEKELNSIVVNSFQSQGLFAYKIPDPPQMVAQTSSKRPFDCFACTPENSWYIESKFSNGITSIPFNSVREHQYEALLNIEECGDPYTLPVLLVGFWEPRKFFEVITFRFRFFYELSLTLKTKSIPKKIVQKIFEDGRTVPIKKKQFDIEQLREKMIDGDFY